MSSWINADGEVAHPNAPKGAGGPGKFKNAGPWGRNLDLHDPVAHPNSPVGRYLALNDNQKKKLKKRKAAQTSPAPPSTKAVTDQAVQASVADNAKKLVGKKIVGSGECYDLPDKLLTLAQGKSAPDFTHVPDNFKDAKARAAWYKEKADYIWGDPIDVNSVQSGDILQFRDHIITIDMHTTDKAGNWYDWHEEHPRGHHTAVVSSNDGNSELTVIEQHVVMPGTKTLSPVVRENKLQLINKSYVIKKTTSVKDPKLGNLTGELTINVTVKVKGTVKGYRPKAK